MNFSISQFEFGERPPVTLPSPELLKLLSEEGIRKMVSDHYDLLSKSSVSHLFPRIDEALDKAKQRSSDFFIQICGGHPYYNKSRGKPMLASRHSPFAITEEARVVARGALLRGVGRRGVGGHAAEFVESEGAVVVADAGLAEEDGAAG